MRALLRSCSATGPPAPVEVKDCQGQKRDSMADFQENSILSPQQVEAATYQQVIDTNPPIKSAGGMAAALLVQWPTEA